MARMIPQTLPFDAPGSEQRVFELLRDGPGTGDWTVIWSYRPVQLELESRRRREVDFLILIPKAGILCLEVKGGQFEIRDGSWYPAGTSKSIESPDRQSEQAMFTLRNDLIRQFQREPSVLSAPMDFAVAHMKRQQSQTLTLASLYAQRPHESLRYLRRTCAEYRFGPFLSLRPLHYNH